MRLKHIDPDLQDEVQLEAEYLRYIEEHGNIIDFESWRENENRNE